MAKESLQAVARIRLSEPSGTYRTLDAIVNTGFNGFLTLPPDRAEERSRRPRPDAPNFGCGIERICQRPSRQVASGPVDHPLPAPNTKRS